MKTAAECRQRAAVYELVVDGDDIEYAQKGLVRVAEFAVEWTGPPEAHAEQGGGVERDSLPLLFADGHLAGAEGSVLLVFTCT